MAVRIKDIVVDNLSAAVVRLREAAVSRLLAAIESPRLHRLVSVTTTTATTTTTTTTIPWGGEREGKGGLASGIELEATWSQIRLLRGQCRIIKVGSLLRSSLCFLPPSLPPSLPPFAPRSFLQVPPP